MKEIILCDRGNYKEAANLCKKYNIGVNLDSFADLEICDKSFEEVKYNLALYQNIKITCMHAPIDGLCMGNLDKEVREFTMKAFEYSYKVAKLIECPSINFHNGFDPNLHEKDEWIKNSSEFLKEFLEDKDDSIVIYLENKLEFTPDVIIDLINRVGDSRLIACLDVGHANAHSNTDVLEWIKGLGNKLGLVHLHNNYGEKDEHLSLDNGSINFNGLCETLEKFAPDSTWAIEVNELQGAYKSIKWLIKNKYLKSF